MLRQLVELIPAYLVPKLVRETGADRQARTFTPWSHVVTMLFAQVSHAFGLNDVCDALGLWATPLRALRGATSPSRNNLSHANKTRDCALTEKLFWRMLAHLQTLHSGFARGGQNSLAWRFRRTIHVVAATAIQLVVNCITREKHRRRKAAAKCHLRLDLQSFLPSLAIVDTAGGVHHPARGHLALQRADPGRQPAFHGELHFPHPRAGDRGRVTRALTVGRARAVWLRGARR